MSLPELARGGPDPLASFDLDILLEGAAGLRGERIALSDAADQVTFGEADRRASALAVYFGALGLSPGETVMIAAEARVDVFIAIAAATRAGMNVALAPPWSNENAIGRMALLAGAAAIIGAPREGRTERADFWLAAAASAPCVRLLCSLGEERIDGAAPIDLRQLAPADRPARVERQNLSCIVTFEGGAKPIVHRQQTLIAAALDLVARAKIGMRLPIVSTILPASFAGLVAGPAAALVSGASLHYNAPFDARAFLALVDAHAPAHLVAPAPIGPMLERAGLFEGGRLASVLFLERADGLCRPSPESATRVVSDNAPPITDLYAFGERAIVTEARISARKTPPAAEPHWLDLDGSRVLAIGWSDQSPQAQLTGAAVTQP